MTATDPAPPRRTPAKPTKAAYARRLPHLQPPNATLFVTFNTWKRNALPEHVRSLVLNHILYDHSSKFALHAAVVMPDHIHLLLTPGRDSDGNTYGVAEIVQSIKSTSAHSLNRAFGRTGRVWQPERFDRALRSNESVRQKAEYICANPVRAQLVAGEDEWPWLWREWIEGVRGDREE